MGGVTAEKGKPPLKCFSGGFFCHIFSRFLLREGMFSIAFYCERGCFLLPSRVFYCGKGCFLLPSPAFYCILLFLAFVVK